jgi:hypothetical protein
MVTRAVFLCTMWANVVRQIDEGRLQARIPDHVIKLAHM